MFYKLKEKCKKNSTLIMTEKAEHKLKTQFAYM